MGRKEATASKWETRNVITAHVLQRTAEPGWARWGEATAQQVHEGVDNILNRAVITSVALLKM